MAEYDLDELIGRTFLLSPYQKGEKHRASMKHKVIQITEKLDEDHYTVIDKVNLLWM